MGRANVGGFTSGYLGGRYTGLIRLGQEAVACPMRELLEMATRGTEAILKSPKMSAALYAAVMAVLVTIGFREDS